MKLRNNFGLGDAAPASIRFLVLRATTQQARDLGWRHLPLRNGSIEILIIIVPVVRLVCLEVCRVSRRVETTVHMVQGPVFQKLFS